MSEWRPFAPPTRPVSPEAASRESLSAREDLGAPADLNAPAEGGLPAKHEEVAATQKKKGVWPTILAGLAFVATKAKALFLVLKAIPFLLTGLSMLSYMWLLALASGWKFGVGFVLLILIHELGHGAVMHQYGMKPGWPVFIPLFGAAISSKVPAPSRDADAAVSFGGPFYGTLASLLVMAVYFAARHPFWLVLGSTGVFINMFNMLPIRPLDGGAIVELFSRRAWILGAAVLVGLVIAAPASPAIIVLALSIPRLFSRRDKTGEEPVAKEIRTKWALRYFGLLAVMGGALYFARQLLHLPHAS